MNMEQGARSGAPLNYTRRQNSVYIDTTPRIENFAAEVDRTENGALICPVFECGQNHSHILNAITPYIGRRDGIPAGWSIQAWCESGHDYTIVIREYKGQVEIFAIPDGSIA